jgi:hypothetical protein
MMRSSAAEPENKLLSTFLSSLSYERYLDCNSFVDLGLPTITLRVQAAKGNAGATILQRRYAENLFC